MHIEPVECHRLYPPDHVLRERDERIERGTGPLQTQM